MINNNNNIRWNKYLFSFIICLSIILIITPPAGAAVTQLTSFSDFSASATIITFDDLATGTHVSNQYSGVTFLDDKARTPLIVDKNNRGGTATKSEPNALFNDVDYPSINANLPLVMTFDKPIRKVGMYIGNGKQAQLTGILTAYDSAGKSIGSANAFVPDPVTGFIGLGSDTDIYKVTLDYGETNYGEEIDNLMFEGAGQAGTTITISPEAPTPEDEVTITAEFSQQLVQYVEIWVNKEKVRDCQISPCIYKGGPFSTDTLEYWVDAYDFKGIAARSEIVLVDFGPYILVDSTNPQVTASHSPSSPSASQTVTFTAEASDARGLHRVLLWVDGEYVADCYDTDTCTYTGGPYTGRVRYYGYAIDTSDNYASSGYQYVNIGPVDTTKPTVSVSHSPPNPSASQTVTFTATASDPSGIRRLLIWADGSYVHECPGSPCTYTGEPYAGPRVKYYAYAIDNYDNYQATDYKYVYIGERDREAPEVYALHSSMYPTHGQRVTFTAKATDNHASGIDHIWLWVDGSYVQRCDSDECTYTGGPYADDNIRYFALAYDESGNRGFSGYIDFSVGPYSGNTVPIFHTGDPRTRVDVVFIPSTEYDGDLGEFYDNIYSVIEDAYYESDPIFQHRAKFNFYVYKNSVAVGTTTWPGVAGTICDWSAPSGWDSVTFEDSGAIVHQSACRDSAGSGLFSSEWDSRRTFVHETGHAVFAVADEYCCDSSYWEGSPYPNIWSSNTRCRNAATANGWDPDDCEQLSDGTDTISWWKSDPEPDIMKTGGGTVWAFNRADLRNVEYLFDECETGGC